MSNLLDQLQRESDDLCGHRGLTPGTNLSLSKKIRFIIFYGSENWNQNQIFTLILLSLGSDHQTFSMSLPTRLRDYYDKVVTPAADSGIHETFYDIYIELK